MARIRLATIPTSDVPPAGQVSVYAKSDNNLYLQNALGNEFQILTDGTPGVGGYQVEQFTLDLAEVTAKEVTLSLTPVQPTRTLVFIDGAPPAFYGLDFIVAGNSVQWTSLRLDGLLAVGDLIQVVYF